MPSFSAKRSTSSDGLNCLSFTRYANSCFPDVKAAITHCGLKRLLRSKSAQQKTGGDSEPGDGITARMRCGFEMRGDDGFQVGRYAGVEVRITSEIHANTQ